MIAIDLQRRDGESALGYQKRIVYGKLVDKTLADIDYTELAELVYGQPYSSDVARRMFYGSKRTLDLIESEGVTDEHACPSDIDDKIIELRKERQRFYDMRNDFNKLVRERARQEELNDIIKRTINDAVGNGSLSAFDDDGGTFAVGGETELLVSLNDIHYGAVVNNAWRKYDSDVCRNMMDEYADRIISIAKLHGCSGLTIACAGDIISGNIHYGIAVSNRENVIKQVMGASELIAGFINKLSPYFDNVRYVSVAGNHSRLNPSKDMALASERLDDIVTWYLQARLAAINNVHINSINVDPTVAVFCVCGKRYALVHGDYDGSEAKVQALNTMLGGNLYAVLSGHLHHNETNDVQGIKTLMAGSFLGVDEFCVEKRILGNPEQMICVCDGDGVVCHYDISL